MTRIFITSAVFIFLLSCTLKVDQPDAAKTDTEKEKLDRQCEAIMKAFRDQNIDEAMSMLKKISVIHEAQIDTLHSKIIRQQSVFDTYGKPVSFDFVEERKIKI